MNINLQDVANAYLVWPTTAKLGEYASLLVQIFKDNDKSIHDGSEYSSCYFGRTLSSMQFVNPTFHTSLTSCSIASLDLSTSRFTPIHPHLYARKISIEHARLISNFNTASHEEAKAENHHPRSIDHEIMHNAFDQIMEDILPFSLTESSKIRYA